MTTANRKAKKKEPVFESPYWSGPVIEPRDWRSLPLSELTRAELNMAFCETYLRVPEGDLMGQPIRFEDFQERFFYSVYDNPTPTRRAYLSIARKNAKTALIACINLVHIIGPEAVRNSRIQSGAMSQTQATEVYNYCVKMLRFSDALIGLVRITGSLSQIIGLPMNVTYRATAADGKTNMGGSPIVAILDETGQVQGPHSEFVSSVETSQGAYSNPLLFVISTQAAEDTDLFSIWLDDAKRSKPDNVVCHVYTSPPEADLSDERGWYASNPALGKFRSYADLKDLIDSAIRMPSRANSVRNLNLNQRVSAASMFVSHDVWRQGDREIVRCPDSKYYGGLDLSGRKDLTCFAITWEVDGDTGVDCYFWTPEDGLADREKKDRAPYLLWKEQGYLRTTPGATVDYEFVAHEIAEILSDYPELEGVAFDRWRIDILRKEFDRIGFDLNLVDFGQGFKDMSPAIDEIESRLLNGLLAHGGNPVLRMCAANASITTDPADNRKFDKRKSTGRIDGIQAATMAIGLSKRGNVEEEEPHSNEPKIFFV